MENTKNLPHHLNEFFYEHMENLKIKYQALVTDDQDKEILDQATEEIQAIEYDVGMVKEEEKLNGIDIEQRKLCVYITEQNLYGLYSEIGFESQLESLLREF